jgi:CRP-like cAMP-binding protein
MTDLNRSVATERVLALTRLAALQILPAEDLSLIALAATEEVVSRRTVLVAAGERPRALHVPLIGELELSGRGARSSAAENPARAGALALLGQIPMGANLVAPAGTVLLVVPLDTLLALLEERGQLCRSLLRTLAARLRQSGRVGGPTFRVSGGPLSTRTDLFSRMLVFRKLLGPGGGGMGAVARLAREAQELRLEPGVSFTLAADQADIMVVTQGSLRFVRNDGTEHVARAGEVVGLVEAVAGVPFATRAEALVPTAVLTLSAAELAQAIEDEDLLCLDLVRGFAGELAALEQNSSKDETCSPPATSAPGPTARLSS